MKKRETVNIKEGHVVYFDTSSVDTAIRSCEVLEITVVILNNTPYVKCREFYNHTGYEPRDTHGDNDYAELRACYHHFKSSESKDDPDMMCGKCGTRVKK